MSSGPQGRRKNDPFSPQARWGDDGARRVEASNRLCQRTKIVHSTNLERGAAEAYKLLMDYPTQHGEALAHAFMTVRGDSDMLVALDDNDHRQDVEC